MTNNSAKLGFFFMKGIYFCMWLFILGGIIMGCVNVLSFLFTNIFVIGFNWEALLCCLAVPAMLIFFVVITKQLESDLNEIELLSRGGHNEKL